MRTLILLKGLVKSEKLKWVKDEGLNNYLLDIEVIERLYSYPELSGFKKEVLRKSQSTLVYKQFIEILFLRMSRGNLIVLDMDSGDTNGVVTLAKIFGYNIFYKVFKIPQDYISNHSKYIFNYCQNRKKSDLELEVKQFLNFQIIGNEVHKYSDVIKYWKSKELVIKLGKNDRTLLVSDIHSNYSLFKKLNHPSYDLCVCLGDYIDGYEKGGSRKLIDFIASNKILYSNVLFLEGNHEIRLRKYLGWLYLRTINSKSIITSTLYSSIPDEFLESTALEFSDLSATKAWELLDILNERLFTHAILKRDGKTYVCSHSGFKYMAQISPEYIGSLIYGSRNIEEQDRLFSKNYKNKPIYSIHGHCYYMSKWNPVMFPKVVNLDPEQTGREIVFTELTKNNKFKINTLCQEK